MAEAGDYNLDENLAHQLQGRLDAQVHRTNLFSELLRLLSSSLSIEEILERAATKSTEVLGDTAAVVLTSGRDLRLANSYSKNRDHLVRMLVAAWNAKPHGTAAELLDGVINDDRSLMIEDLQRSHNTVEMRGIIEECSLMSLMAVPIRKDERVFGAFISVSTAPRRFDQQDAEIAAIVADFMATSLEYAQLSNEVNRSGMTDSVTGVYNIRFFRETIDREASRAQRYGGPLSLIRVDVHARRPIHDTLGRLAGDEVLAHVGKLISATVRKTDFVCRTGEDEFGVVLPGTPRDGAIRTADKILQKVKTSQILHTLGYDGPLTVKIRAAEYRNGNPIEAFLNEAD
jgi:diguanylate cyclase (GGDEF)-like protein